ncbi:TetR/AcrR family transcriptional regulator [Cupriavidus necator]|uniref:TetR/AcrR family transcriptional regulator n=1 Tax=Cupriavidus necator TaxID=106590 RepID=UPI0027870CFA|nr:TetR/AcrR family transcriptional regulator [Cupriavidus necator]MDQ0141244.1 AcrR family transcriptional regulator [Cupriavidus necator]
MSELMSQDTLAALNGQQGFNPPRYGRAGRTAEALLEAGRQLLRERTLDSLTNQEICAAAHVTTGAFYGRFKSKQAFFRAMQAVTAEDTDRSMGACLAAIAQGNADLAEAVHTLLSELRRVTLRNLGVLRATILEADGNAWQGFKRRRAAFIERAVPVLAARHQAGDAELLYRRIRIAFQFAIGSIINAVLNDPGPLRLSSREFDMELTRAFCAYVAAP